MKKSIVYFFSLFIMCLLAMPLTYANDKFSSLQGDRAAAVSITDEGVTDKSLEKNKLKTKKGKSIKPVHHKR